MVASQGEFDLNAPRPREGVPLFDSGAEATEHGCRDLEKPSQRALDAAERLQSKYPRLA
jgi:hypothetical protein